jgi:hypothetical protein
MRQDKMPQSSSMRCCNFSPLQFRQPISNIVLKRRLNAATTTQTGATAPARVPTEQGTSTAQFESAAVSSASMVPNTPSANVNSDREASSASSSASSATSTTTTITAAKKPLLLMNTRVTRQSNKQIGTEEQTQARVIREKRSLNRPAQVAEPAGKRTCRGK